MTGSGGGGGMGVMVQLVVAPPPLPSTTPHDERSAAVQSWAHDTFALSVHV